MGQSLKLGVAGLGTVGGGLLRHLETHKGAIALRAGRPIEVMGVSARSRNKDRGVDLSAYRWFDDPVALARDPDIDVFVELIGWEDGVAKAAVEAALAAGKHVVTANKALLAHHGTALARLAEKHKVSLNFEAAVTAAVPVIKTLRENLAGNEITRVFGILNGTCNYILTLMHKEGRSFDDVLREAQAEGYAEADPTFDIEGHDAAHKLAILASLAFGTEVSFESIYREGIQTVTPEDLQAADELGYRIKLLGVALKTDSGIEQRVHPTMIPKDSAIADVDGVTNCVAINTKGAGDILLIGPGAGAEPTASAVVSDLVDIARGHWVPPFLTPAAKLAPYRRARMRAHEGGYYIRLSVIDRPGAFAAIAKRMAEQNISLESIVQKRRGTPIAASGGGEAEAGAAPVLIITHETTESAMAAALKAIEADGHVTAPPQMIRIETL